MSWPWRPTCTAGNWVAQLEAMGYEVVTGSHGKTFTVSLWCNDEPVYQRDGDDPVSLLHRAWRTMSLARALERPPRPFESPHPWRPVRGFWALSSRDGERYVAVVSWWVEGDAWNYTVFLPDSVNCQSGTAPDLPAAITAADLVIADWMDSYLP